MRLRESKALEKAPMQEKVRSCEFFASQDSHNRTFLCSGGAFPEANRAAKAEAIRRDLSGTRALRSPPAGTPADASPGYVPQTYLTGASYERALRKREGKWAR